jgi:hypothetical protein
MEHLSAHRMQRRMEKIRLLLNLRLLLKQFGLLLEAGMTEFF